MPLSWPILMIKSQELPVLHPKRQSGHLWFRWLELLVLVVCAWNILQVSYTKHLKLFYKNNLQRKYFTSKQIIHYLSIYSFKKPHLIKVWLYFNPFLTNKSFNKYTGTKVFNQKKKKKRWCQVWYSWRCSLHFPISIGFISGFAHLQGPRFGL